MTWDLLAGTNQIRNLHAASPLSIQLANDDWTLSFGCDAYTTQETDDAIAAALTNYFTRAEVTVTVVAAIDESKAYTDTQLADYSTTTQMTQAITDGALRNGGPAGHRNRGSPRGFLRLHSNGRRNHGGAGALRDCGRAGHSHRGGAGVRHAEQRPELERRADLQPAPGQQRPAEPVGGRRIDRHLSKTWTTPS